MAEGQAKQEQNIIAVLLRVDNGGSTTVLCTNLNQDPMFPTKVVLSGIVGVSFPVAGQWLKTIQWAVEKDVVINWMVGPLRPDFELTAEELLEGEKKVPWPPGVNPHQDFISHPEEVEPFINRETPAPAPAPAPDPPPKSTPPTPPKRTLKEAAKEARAAGEPPPPLEEGPNPEAQPLRPMVIRG